MARQGAGCGNPTSHRGAGQSPAVPVVANLVPSNRRRGMDSRQTRRARQSPRHSASQQSAHESAPSPRSSILGKRILLSFRPASPFAGNKRQPPKEPGCSRQAARTASISSALIEFYVCVRSIPRCDSPKLVPKEGALSIRDVPHAGASANRRWVREPPFPRRAASRFAVLSRATWRNSRKLALAS
jgi:hypothetical protein